MAQDGWTLIYDAIVKVLQAHPEGLAHVKIARHLGLEISYHGGSTYASQMILHQLVHRGVVTKIGEGRYAIFLLAK